MGLQLYQRFVLHDPRPAGSFFNPNFMGELMSISSIVFIALALFGKDRVRDKGIYIFFFLLSLAALILTKSRGAAISCLTGISLVLFFRLRWKALAIILSFFVLFAVLPNPLRERVVSRADAYRYSRLSIYDAGLRVVSDHPLGVGLGNFKYYYDQYESPVAGAVSLYGKKARTLHNEHLQVLVEQGVIGLILYLGFVISLLLKIIFPPRSVPHPLRAITFGAGASFLVHASVDSLYHTFALPLVMLAIVGLYIGEAEIEWEEAVLRKGMKVPLALFTVASVTYCTATVSSFYLSSLGERQARMGSFDSAITLLRVATAADFLDGRKHETKGAIHYRTFLKKGDIFHFKMAIYEVENALRRQKRSASLRGRKAFLLQQGIHRGLYTNDEVGNLDEESIRLYSAQLVIEPHNVFAMKNLATLFSKSGRNGEAERILVKAVSTEPNFAIGYYLLGKMREIRGEKEEASFLYKRALSVYKKYAGLKGLDTYAEKLIMLDDQTLNDLRVKIDERE
ncbi:MAG: hypothetical protein GTN70_03200 [Deltaproteobacteria bacterium]|nr:hypothetical protein [Deltaproteobacteria bacterium]